MKDLVNKLLIIVIFLITAFFLSMFILMDKKEFSEEENRYLSSFSINNISEYISDHFPFRNLLIKLKNQSEVLMGKTFINGVYLGDDGYLISEFKTTDKRDMIIKKINEFFDKNANVDVMIVPDSIVINEDKLNYHPEINAEEEINYLYSNLKTFNIDLVDSLKKENAINNNLYFKTDHHWTTHGAFVAYQEYFMAKNKQALLQSDFDIVKVSDNFLGTSSSLALGLASEESIYLFKKELPLKVEYVYENKVENTLYNFEYLNKKDKYSLFLDNNHALIEINNENLNDNSSIVVIKNSFGNCFIPFIVNHYQNTYVIDLRYFSGSVTEFINENKIDDKLILYNLNNLYSDMSIIKLK